MFEAELEFLLSSVNLELVESLVGWLPDATERGLKQFYDHIFCPHKFPPRSCQVQSDMLAREKWVDREELNVREYLGHLNLNAATFLSKQQRD